MKPIHEYLTPETDDLECAGGDNHAPWRHARLMEQRLAMCREMLEDLLPVPWARPYPDGPCLEKSDWNAIRETLAATAPPQ